MNTFVMHLQSPSQYERIDDIISFVGIDESGSFGILPRHERMMTVLSPGIMRFILAGNEPEYLGLAESVLRFVDNQLFISCHKYLRDRNYEHLADALVQKLHEEEEELAAMRETIRQMEEALLKQLVRTPGAELL
jgi:F-type H+-transporting ATPase subunit epsilon